MPDWTFEFTPEKLAQCAKRYKNIPELFEALSAVLPKYEINTPARVAAFLAECGHESADFTIVQENLNYSAKGLQATWPKRFATLAEAALHERNPEKIANKVYANRLGNGDEASGDGWRYRGRGAIQLTGKENYLAFGKFVGKSLDETVTYLETLPGAIESACWFWKRNNLNVLADAKDIDTATKRINGGTIGSLERRARFEENLKVLGG